MSFSNKLQNRFALLSLSSSSYDGTQTKKSKQQKKSTTQCSTSLAKNTKSNNNNHENPQKKKKGKGKKGVSTLLGQFSNNTSSLSDHKFTESPEKNPYETSSSAVPTTTTTTTTNDVIYNYNDSHSGNFVHSTTPSLATESVSSKSAKPTCPDANICNKHWPTCTCAYATKIKKEWAESGEEIFDEYGNCHCGPCEELRFEMSYDSSDPYGSYFY